jgi:hypothetical protein
MTAPFAPTLARCSAIHSARKWLDRGAGRYGDRWDRSIGVVCSPAPARFCGEQEFCGLERFRPFGPYRSREYRGARPAARSQFLRSCFDRSYVTAAASAASNIFGADILDTALGRSVSGATSRQISNALPRRSHRHAPKSPRAYQTPFAVISKSAVDNPEVG